MTDNYNLHYIFCVAVNTCKQKWKNVRSAFVRNLKSAPSGSSATSKKPYYLNDSMQFLLPFVKTNAPDSDTQGNLPSPVARGTENIESENESESENLEVQNEIAVEDTEPDVTEPTEPVVRRRGTIQKTAKNKAKKRKSDVFDLDKTFVEFCDSRKNRSENEDPNKMFLMSLLPEVNQMNPQKTRRFKRQVMNLIDEILDGPLSMTASNANYGQSATFHTSSRPSSASSSIHTYNVKSWSHGSSLSTTPSPAPLVTLYTPVENEWSSTNTTSTPLPSPSNIVENRWPNHISTTHSREPNNIPSGNQWPNVWPLSNNSNTCNLPPN